MGDFNKLMDSSTEENMKTLKGVTANGSKIDSVSKAHTQLDKIFENDPKVMGRK